MSLIQKLINECDYKEKAIILGTGGQASIHYSKNFSTSADVFVIKIRQEKIKLQYVYYFLQSNIFLLENGFQGVALKHLSKEYLSNLKIPLPPLAEQEKLVFAVEKLENKISEASIIIEGSALKKQAVMKKYLN